MQLKPFSLRGSMLRKVILGVVVVLALLTSIRQVGTGQLAVVTRFGKVVNRELGVFHCQILAGVASNTISFERIGRRGTVGAS